jgi:DNA-directed RNA polymerase subunit alpha
MDAAPEFEQLMAKDNWAQEDCQKLERLFAQMREPARKLREAVGAIATAKPAGALAVKLGVARYLLCQFADALEALIQGTDNKERRYYQALCHKQLHQWDKALENFQLALDRGWDAKAIALEKAEALCLNGQAAEAAKLLEKSAKASQDDPEWHYAAGLAAEMQGDAETAIRQYEHARRLVPGHPKATFRLAYYYDLHGDEETALELYRECVVRSSESAPARPVYANALLNMSVLFDDIGRYEDAARCLKRILVANPNHARARLFLKDVQSSKTMTFDEDEAKRVAKRNDILAIPVTDFELSIRARNCLKKMNIRILGDLLHVTELELLSYKNFGETSLAEIKGMLASKGLRLGQMREDAVAKAAASTELPEGGAVGNEGVLATPLAQIEFSVRARKALERLNVKTLGELAIKTEAEMLACRNFGQTSLNEVKQRLAEFGLTMPGPEAGATEEE